MVIVYYVILDVVNSRDAFKSCTKCLTTNNYWRNNNNENNKIHNYHVIIKFSPFYYFHDSYEKHYWDKWETNAKAAGSYELIGTPCDGGCELQIVFDMTLPVINTLEDNSE